MTNLSPEIAAGAAYIQQCREARGFSYDDLFDHWEITQRRSELRKWLVSIENGEAALDPGQANAWFVGTHGINLDARYYAEICGLDPSIYHGEGYRMHMMRILHKITSKPERGEHLKGETS